MRKHCIITTMLAIIIENRSAVDNEFYRHEIGLNYQKNNTVYYAGILLTTSELSVSPNALVTNEQRVYDFEINLENAVFASGNNRRQVSGGHVAVGRRIVNGSTDLCLVNSIC